MKNTAFSPRLYQASTSLVEIAWLTAVILVPLVVNPWGFNYELPKVALLRALTLLLLAAHFLTLAYAAPAPDPQHWLHRPLVRPILLVAVSVFLSSLLSISPLVSLWGTYQRQQGAYLLMVLILWALLVATHLRARHQRRRLITTLVVVGSLVALTPFLESFYWQENPFTWRPGGSLGNPIFLGAYLIMIVPFTLSRLIEARAWRRAGWGLALALQLAALLVTQSRGPAVAALVGLAFFAALVLWPVNRRLALVGLVAGPLLVGGLVVGLNFGLTPSSSLSRLPYVRRIVRPQGVAGDTVRVRLLLWQAAIEVATTWPEIGLSSDRHHLLRPLVGYGPDTATIVYTSVYPPELAHIEDPSAIWDRAHNETLDLLVMRGWFGVVAYLVLGIACVRQGTALWRTASDTAERARAVAPLLALMAHVVEIQFAFSVTTTSMMAWLCLALLASIKAEETEPTSQRQLEVITRPARRWQICAVTGALLLLFVAVRLEGGAMSADVLVSRARALDQNGRWQESLALYDRALALVPWQATYHQFRGEAFYNLARVLPPSATAL
jgi:O-antigen ligase